MAATFMPNFLINSSLKEKAGEVSPGHCYLRGLQESACFRKWKLADDSSDNRRFLTRQARVLFRKDGKLAPEEIQKLLKVIKG